MGNQSLRPRARLHRRPKRRACRARTRAPPNPARNASRGSTRASASPDACWPCSSRSSAPVRRCSTSSAIAGVYAVVGDSAHDLVDLLIVLVSPHIRFEGRREGVVGDPLEPVGEQRIAQYLQEHLQREHLLDDRAELRSLRWAQAGQMLVAAEDAGHLAVVAVESRGSRDRLRRGRRHRRTAGTRRPLPSRPSRCSQRESRDAQSSRRVRPVNAKRSKLPRQS